MHKNQLQYMQKKVNLIYEDSKPGQTEDLSTVLLKEGQQELHYLAALSNSKESLEWSESNKIWIM